jgi:catalase
MIRLNKIFGVAGRCYLLGFLLAASVSAAPPPQAKAYGRDKKNISDRAVVIPADDGTVAVDAPERKGRPDLTQPGGAVQGLVKDFQKAREDYLTQQKELLKLYNSASAEERAIIREQIKDSLDKWKEQQKEYLQQQKEQAQEMKKNLQTELQKVVDETVKEGGRGR